MKFQTKTVFIRFCANCPCCKDIAVMILENSLKTRKRCKYPDLERKWQGKNPLDYTGYSYDYFPDWGPLKDGDVVDV